MPLDPARRQDKNSGFRGRTIGMNGCQSSTNVCASVSVLQLEFSSMLRISLREMTILQGLTNSWQPIQKKATFVRLGSRCVEAFSIKKTNKKTIQAIRWQSERAKQLAEGHIR